MRIFSAVSAFSAVSVRNSATCSKDTKGQTSTSIVSRNYDDIFWPQSPPSHREEPINAQTRNTGSVTLCLCGNNTSAKQSTSFVSIVLKDLSPRVSDLQRAPAR